MMDERELDRAIDTAAGRMMALEPGRALSYTVMARVRERHTPAPRRFVWIIATASLVLCGALTIALMYRAPATIMAPPPAARTVVVGQPPVAIPHPMLVAPETAAPPRRIPRAPLAARVVSPVQLPPGIVSGITPIETEGIALSAIDVPGLEREAAVIDILDIEPLTIEPLTASND
jgi:hypothetical protein